MLHLLTIYGTVELHIIHGTVHVETGKVCKITIQLWAMKYSYLTRSTVKL